MANNTEYQAALASFTDKAQQSDNNVSALKRIAGVKNTYDFNKPTPLVRDCHDL